MQGELSSTDIFQVNWEHMYLNRRYSTKHKNTSLKYIKSE